MATEHEIDKVQVLRVVQNIQEAHERQMMLLNPGSLTSRPVGTLAITQLIGTGVMYEMGLTQLQKQDQNEVRKVVNRIVNELRNP
jgi:hypothetical protein